MLTLSEDVYDALVGHAREETPEEVCGVLGGVHDPGTSRAIRDVRVPNAAAAPRTRYELDPGEQFAAMREVEDAGDEVVGFYHSHPAGPFGPSGTDASLATWEGYSYVIVVLAGAEPYVGSWRWRGDDGGFEQEVVAVER